MDAFIIDGLRVPGPEGTISNNYMDDAEPHFQRRKRKKRIDHIVIHETAGRSAAGCKRTLQRKGYGVHIIVARDGTISNHGDLLLDQMIHANQLNATSIGIEIVNPYSPVLARGMDDIHTTQSRWWTWIKDEVYGYVMPTSPQMRAMHILLPWLCSQLDIPYTFPTQDLDQDHPKIKGWRAPPLGWRAKPRPGIVAHRDFAKHADGRWPLEYLAETREREN